MRRFAPKLFGPLLLVIAACSSDPPAPIDPSLPGGGTGGKLGNDAGRAGSSFGGSPSGPGKCAGPGYKEPAEPQQVDEVSARLVDQDGSVIANEPVQVCGSDVCFYGVTTEAGGVAIRPGQSMTKPAFKFGEGKVSARFAWLLPAEPVVDLGTVQSVRLPSLADGAALEPGNTATSNGLSITPAEGSAITHDRLTFQTPEERRLRAVRVGLDVAPPVVDAELGLELLYAATPVETVFCPPSRLAIENTEGWAAGTQVEVFLHGVDIEEAWAPYGGWAKVADAVVSEDAARVETLDPGLPVLGVLGFRRK